MWQRRGMDVLAAALALEPVPADTLAEWWRGAAARREGWASPIERAIVGGASADRVGFAFLAGYVEALRALVPDAEDAEDAEDEPLALCATEEGGNHPRAIRTTLAPDGPGRYRLTGKKTWSTAATDAARLLVVASTGEHEGKNRLRVVRVARSAAGVHLIARPTPFVPEIPHAEVVLNGVTVAEADVLPGDGYADYLKPFRTVEDLHVHAALAGYLIGVARRRGFARSIVEALLASCATSRALAQADRKAPATHLALAGLLAGMTGTVTELERAWDAVPDPEWQRWQRDRPLLRVASGAREARRERAWAALG
jgi:acyl-CoA dehydrogenase